MLLTKAGFKMLPFFFSSLSFFSVSPRLSLPGVCSSLFSLLPPSALSVSATEVLLVEGKPVERKVERTKTRRWLVRSRLLLVGLLFLLPLLTKKMFANFYPPSQWISWRAGVCNSRVRDRPQRNRPAKPRLLSSWHALLVRLVITSPKGPVAGAGGGRGGG